MERDGVVRQVGGDQRRAIRVFRELTPEVRQLLSRAYIPLLIQLIGVFVEVWPRRSARGLLRGWKRLAGELSSGAPRTCARVHAASEVLNEQLGAVTRVEENGRYVIRGDGCPAVGLDREASGDL